MKLMNILARFSTDFSVTIVAATQVLSWKKEKKLKEINLFSGKFKLLPLLITSC